MGNTISYKKEVGLIVVGALIFTASFLWKDLLVDIEELYFPKEQDLLGRMLYVFVVTLILVLLAVHLKSWLGLTTSTNLNSDPDKNEIVDDQIDLERIAIPDLNGNISNGNGHGD